MVDIRKNTIFIISSFHEKYHNTIDLAIKPAIEEAGFVPSIADGSQKGSQNIFKDIENKIYESAMCIADITVHYDENGNPIDLKNIFYEIACVQTIQKHVILLSTNPEHELPYDLSHLRVTLYDPDNLLELKQKIVQEIQKFRHQPAEKVFSKVELLTDELKFELENLRKRAVKMYIEVDPPIADIFVNDRLLGTSPQEFYVNPSALRNTISIAAPSYYEEHIVLEEEDYQTKHLKISLQQVPAADSKDLLSQEKRTYGWLVNRRKDPNNPVLMRAVAQFLARAAKNADDAEIKEQFQNDAQKELEELLRVAPGWYMAHNQMGVFYKDDFDKSIEHYKIATALNPKSYLGYFNQACAYARAELFHKTIEMLEIINEDDDLLESYSYSNMRLKDERAFESIKRSDTFKSKFNSLVSQIDAKAKQMKEERAV